MVMKMKKMISNWSDLYYKKLYNNVQDLINTFASIAGIISI